MRCLEHRGCAGEGGSPLVRRRAARSDADEVRDRVGDGGIRLTVRRRVESGTFDRLIAPRFPEIDTLEEAARGAAREGPATPPP